ncbi:MAG: HlyD family efflux transporter periplasmic adaptor subunit [Planctomycetota bacterium]
MRNLKNTQLFGSYRGQISEVHVVPGSVVSAGSPVLTLQMMDPIKIEFEVSAEQSRQIQRRLQVPVTYLKPDGSRGEEIAIVHVVDPSADPSTRTFTVTLLMLNQQYVPESVASSGAVARTEDIWPVDLNSVVGTPEGTKLFEEKSIHEDENGKFVWVLDKARRKQTLPEKLEVSKAYVNVSDAAIPFLGNWKFTIGTFRDPLPDENLRLVTSKLILPDDLAAWDGKSAVFDSGSQWMLRPGDLVSMDLDTGKKQNGWFVPIQAIYEESGYKYLFVSQDGKAKRMEVMAELPDKLDLDSVVEIKPLEGQNFGPDMDIVVGGVHFLKDGDAIRVTEKLPGAGERAASASASAEAGIDATTAPEKA